MTGGPLEVTQMRQWVGEDDPDRLDAAAVDFRPGGMTAMGTSRAPLWVTCWTLECDNGWRTRRLEVTSRGWGWTRELVLTRDNQGWTSHPSSTGRMDARLGELPPPGIDDLGVLRDAVDCDLGLCPLTNTMPIRRLGLLEMDVGETLLTMAWVDMPSLQVIASPQRYSSHTVSGRRVVRYESEMREFRSDLDVDAYGLVVRYPQLAHALPTTDP
jgi:hypothetical protein